MKIHFFLLAILLIFSCKEEKPFVSELEVSNLKESLKKSTKAESIEKIDSLLSINKFKGDLLAILYHEKGRFLSLQQKDEKALFNFEKSLGIYLKNPLKNKKNIANLYWHLGSSNSFLSNTELATQQLLTALEYAKEINNQKIISNVYGSLAHTYYLLQDYEKAIDYTLQSIDISIAEADTNGISTSYNNLAVIFKNIHDYPQALENNIKSLNLSISLKDTASIAKSYNNIGLVSGLLGDNARSEEYFLKAISLNKQTKQLNSAPLENLANLYLQKNMLLKANFYYYESLKIHEEQNKTKKQAEIFKTLLTISLKEKDFESSLKFQRKADSLNLLHTRKSNTEKLKVLENQFISASNLKDLKQAEEINEKNRIITIILFIVLIFIALYLIQYSISQKLKNEKEKIILEQKVLRSQMNPHFIFNALSSIQNSLLDNNPIASASYLSRFAKLIRQNFDFVNEESILLKDELDALQNYIETQQLRFKDKFDYEIIIHSNIDINIVEIPPLLLQPFVENSIEHGFKNTETQGIILITISQTEEAICFEIKDNGKGFTTAKKDNKMHAIDIFKKRLQLLSNEDEKSFKITSSEKGTVIKFCLKQS